MTQEQITKTFFEIVNHYPSPHNGQPVTVRIIDRVNFDLYFDKHRGLQATDISYIFSFVTMGVFIQHMELCAQSLGHRLVITYNLPDEKDLRGSGKVKFAHCHIDWQSTREDTKLVKVLQTRQTSRKKYFKAVSSSVAQSVTDLAADSGMTLAQLSPAHAKQAIWLNQRAVFDDMFDEPVRKELDKWLRYDQQQKQQTKDGLAYDCMELNGRVLRYVVKHPGVLRLPVMSSLIKQYYLRTMNDTSSVFYMMAPFKTPHDACNVGTVIMKIWIQCAQNGYYIHPFGTIVSNHAAHQDFLRLANIDNETRQNSYLTFIFRAGQSDPPAPSLRLTTEEHLIQEG